MKLRKLSISFGIVLSFILLINIPSLAQEADLDKEAELNKEAKSNEKADVKSKRRYRPILVVNARGFAREVVDPRHPNADCVRVRMFDVTTNTRLGHMIECFENITPEANGGFYLDRTTYFKFQVGTQRGELGAAGVTTIQPVLAGSPERTHIVGDIPPEGTNSIISGTGSFRNATGRVRLSGAANLADLSNRFFDCIFVIDLD